MVRQGIHFEWHIIEDDRRWNNRRSSDSNLKIRDILSLPELIEKQGAKSTDYTAILGVVHFSWIDRFTLLETERTFIFSDFAGSQRENGLI
ncbi:hypothetical protein KFU94_47420 [Chloroflexi bacterium TSY]|nr:hypothetical protein [Chloroflexi bacterium TSY]